MDTMVHRARSLGNWAWLIVLMVGCNIYPTFPIPIVKININSVAPQWIDGKCVIDSMPFTGILYTLFENTNDTAELKVFIHGQEDGVWYKYYPHHILKERRTYRQGMKTGTLEAWWDNGKKQLSYTLERDEYQGTCNEWNRDGILIREMNYNHGYEEGSQKLFYDNGKIRANYVIKNGRRYGLLGTKNCVNAAEKI